jgi:hypothetical protein
MATLHIEHAITDLETWLAAFGRFAEAREKAGVRGVRVYQPVDDERYIVIDLDFATVAEAERFKRFLETNVWSSSQASPGLAGSPRARVLAPVAAAP